MYVCVYIYINTDTYQKKTHIKNDLSNQNGGICRFCSLISFQELLTQLTISSSH